jgi:hypothetical protein
MAKNSGQFADHNSPVFSLVDPAMPPITWAMFFWQSREGSLRRISNIRFLKFVKVSRSIGCLSSLKLLMIDWDANFLIGSSEWSGLEKFRFGYLSLRRSSY